MPKPVKPIASAIAAESGSESELTSAMVAVAAVMWGVACWRKGCEFQGWLVGCLLHGAVAQLRPELSGLSGGSVKLLCAV